MNWKIYDRHVELPERFKKAEEFINLLIHYRFTLCIGFYLSAFPYSIPKQISPDERGLIYFYLYPDVIETIKAEDDYINIVATFESGKEIVFSILYNSIKVIGCVESKITYDFPDGDYDYISDLIERKRAFSRLRKQLKKLNIK